MWKDEISWVGIGCEEITRSYDGRVGTYQAQRLLIVKDGGQLTLPLLWRCVQIMMVHLQYRSGPRVDVLMARKEDTVRIVLTNLLLDVVQSDLLQLPRRSWSATNDCLGNLVVQRRDATVATSMGKLGWVRQPPNGIVGTDFDNSIGLVVNNANASSRVGDEDDGIHKRHGQDSAASSSARPVSWTSCWPRGWAKGTYVPSQIAIDACRPESSR